MNFETTCHPPPLTPAVSLPPSNQFTRIYCTFTLLHEFMHSPVFGVPFPFFFRRPHLTSRLFCVSVLKVVPLYVRYFCTVGPRRAYILDKADTLVVEYLGDLSEYVIVNFE